MITLIICTTLVLIVFLMMRGTESRHRADLFRAAGVFVDAVGNAGWKIIDALARLIAQLFGRPGGVA